MPDQMDSESMRLKAIVERHHPDYVKNIVEWKFLRQSVEGGDGYLKGNLFKHPQEEPEVYAQRSQRATDNHFNICQLVNDTYEGYVFQNLPTETDNLDPLFHSFILQADLEGKPASNLAQEVMHWMDTYGWVAVCVDKPNTDTDVTPANAAQELSQGLIPYAYVVHPTHILNGKITHGIICWLLVQEDVLDNDDPWTSSGQVVTQWRLWEPHQWTLIQKITDAQGERYTSTTGVNELGEIPFVMFYFTEAEGFCCKGLLSDIAHMDRAVFNKASLLDEIHYAATFPQLAIPFDGDLFDEDGLTGEGKQILTMGLQSVLPFRSAAGPPEYVSPSSGPAEVLERNIQKLIQMALSLALLDGEIAKDGHTKTASSGVSKAYVFEKLNRRLSNIADTLEQGFTRVFRLVALWMGKDPATLPACLWSFPDSFEVRSLAQEIADSISLLAAGIPSDTAKKILFKTLVRKAYPKLTIEQLDAIDAEIESFDYTSMNVKWLSAIEDPQTPTDQLKTDSLTANAEKSSARKIAQQFGGGGDSSIG